MAELAVGKKGEERVAANCFALERKGNIILDGVENVNKEQNALTPFCA